MSSRLTWCSLMAGVSLAVAGCSAEPASGGSGGSSAAGGFGGSSAAGGASGFGGASGVGGSSAAGGGSGAGGVGPCARVDIGASRVIPTVQLVIDGSGSMDQPFGGGTRWSSVNDALLGPNGVVRRLEAVVRFGMSIYQTGDVNTCPLLTGPAPALNNFGAIQGAWLQAPGGSTPTGEAMEQIVSMMQATSQQLDMDVGPQIIILATDGAPNGCAGGFNPATFLTCLTNPMDPACAMIATDGYVRTLGAAVDAQAKGIDTYVLDLSDGGLNQQELQKVANVGLGLPEAQTPGAELFVPSNPATLSGALERIIGGAATCDLVLQGMLTDVNAACTSASEVRLNGNLLTCGDPNGWRVVDATHIALVGNACMEWLNNSAAMLNANFPCDLVVPD